MKRIGWVLSAGVLSLTLIGFAGCTRFEPDGLPSAYTLEDKGVSRRLSPAQVETLREILKAHEGLYWVNVVSYASGKVFVNDHMHINHLGQILVINFGAPGDSGWSQVRATLSEDEQARLKLLEAELEAPLSGAGLAEQGLFQNPITPP